MKALVEILKNSQISSLIRAKSNTKTRQLITISENDTILRAWNIFAEFDITGVPVVSDDKQVIFGILSLANLFEFIVGTDEKCSESLLATKISEISGKVRIRRAAQLREQTNLLHLLLDMWDGKCRLDSSEFDWKHLLIRCADGRIEVITPVDFLRYIFIYASSKSRFLHEPSSSQIENGLTIDENSMAATEESATIAIKRLLKQHVLAVVDKDTGALQAGLTVVDFLPSSRDISLLLSLLQDQNITLLKFLQEVKNPRYLLDLEPILIHEHYSAGDLIEKLVRLKIHQLWRVSNDRFHRPIGTVGATEVIAFLAKTVREHLKTE
jgi:CBS domain-containing protein